MHNAALYFSGGVSRGAHSFHQSKGMNVDLRDN